MTAAAVAPVAVETTPARAIVPEPAAAAEAAPVATATDSGVLKLSSIVLSGTANDQVSAIDEAGKLLVDAGAVDTGYVDVHA